MPHAGELEKEVGETGEVQGLHETEVRDGWSRRVMMVLTMITSMPGVFSLRVKKPAMIRMMIVMGIAAMVR